MSTTDNDTTAQAGATTPPGPRRSNRTNKSRPAGKGAPPGPTESIIRPPPAIDAPTGQDEYTTEEQVPPDGFTTVADGTRHRVARLSSTAVVTAGPRDSSSTPPPDENRLLPVAEFFDDDDTTHIPQQPAPTQLEDKFEAIMKAFNSRFEDIQRDNNSRFDDFKHEIIAKIDDANNTRYDGIVAKLDEAIDNAIINKIDDVVNEVNDRVLPIIAKQVTTQVKTAIDSHVAELRQKHTNMHNMDNSISTYKQQIDGELSALRDSNKSITDLLRNMIDDKNGTTDSTHDDDKDDDSNTPNNEDDDTNDDDTDANNNEGANSNTTDNSTTNTNINTHSGIGPTTSTCPPTANDATMDNTALAQLAQQSTNPYAFTHKAWSGAPRAPSGDTSTTRSTMPPNNATPPHPTPPRTPSVNNPSVPTPSNPYVTTPPNPSPTVDYTTTPAAINCLVNPGPYHGGLSGYNTLTDIFLNNCGFATSLAATSLSYIDLTHAYSNLRAIHTLVMAQWYGGRSNTPWSSGTSTTSGPQVYRLIGKQLSILPKLTDTETSTVIDFYDNLHDVTKHFLIATVPFDAIIISQGYHALCIPGLGFDRFQECSKALLELLPHLIDSGMSNNINAALVSVKSTTKCGYDFLWQMLRLTVPGFNPATTAQVPLWQFNSDILEFAKDFLLYFRLQRLLRTPHTDSARSLMFLHAIKGSEYIESVNVLVTAVENIVFADPTAEKPLPDHLQLHSLAQRLSSSTRTRLTSALVPYANMTAYGTPFDGSPYGVHYQQQYQPPPYTQQPSFEQVHHIGPPFEQVHRIGDRRVQFDSNRNSNRPSSLLPSRQPSNRGGDLPPRTREIHPTQARNPSRRPPPNPTRSRRPYVDVQCPACHRRGHHVQNCDMLAMAVSLNHYIRDQLTPDMITTIETNWLERHRPQLDNIRQTPRQVLRAYADTYNYTTADIENSLDWDTWDDTPEPSVNMTEATQDPIE